MHPRTARQPANNFIGKILCVALATLTVSSSSLLAASNGQANIDKGSSTSLLKRQDGGTQDAHQLTELEPGRRIERELSGGMKDSYEIALSEGQYASAIVEQRGIDVMVRVWGPDKELIAAFDTEIRNRGQEKVEFVAEKDGRYWVTVHSKWPKQPLGQYQMAIAEIRAATERDRSLQEARILERESFKLYQQRRFADARPKAERALSIYESVLGATHPNVAGPLSTLAWMDRHQGNFPKAESQLQRSLALREEALGPDHPRVADGANDLGLFYYVRGEHTKAEPLFRRVLEIRERELGAENPLVAKALQNIANWHEAKGEYTEALPLSHRVVEINEKVFGGESLDFARTLQELASLYERIGDFAMAESLHERTLGLMEKLFGEKNHDVSVELERIGELCLNKGDYLQAESLFRRSLRIREALYPTGERSIAYSLYELARVYSEQGNDAKAEPLYLQAMEMLERTQGQNAMEMRRVLRGLAAIARNRGDDAKAESLYQRALSIQEKSFDNTHPDFALALDDLANIYRDKGNFVKAESIYQRALAILENSVGSNHPKFALVLGNLSILYAAKGDTAQAVTSQARANAINEHNLTLILATGSERWKQANLSSLMNDTDRTISLSTHLAPGDIRASELAAAAILQRKGRVLDAMSDNLAALRQRAGAEERKLLDELNQTSTNLAAMVLGSPQGINPADHQKQIKALEERKDKLWEEISRQSAEFRSQSQPITFAAVQSAIPSNGALIEFAVYRPFNPKAIGNLKAYGENRYVAYVVRKGGVQWKELGDAKAIDGAIDKLRNALGNPKRKDVQQLARVVDERMMRPLRPLLGDAKHLFISPDGGLNLVPFESLVDEQDHYLVERFSFTYLTSGRDLLRLLVPRDSKSSAIVLANPLFGEPDLIPMANAGRLKSQRTSVDRKRQHGSKQQSVTSTSSPDVPEVYFAPLGGTAQEAQAIKSLFAEAIVLTGAQASESALKRVSAPRIIHIATHGFFLTDSPTSPSNANRENTGPMKAKAKIVNPLLRSGLALAGANLRQVGGDDGILTALEASGLNLWGTKLVTLSACDTGVGEVKNGEGVYGLRRAFVLAGTETLVMSLWPVSDYVALELMTGYYKGLNQGQGRGEALRQIQLDMLKRKERRHPFYWASFIQSGEWANLAGKH